MLTLLGIREYALISTGYPDIPNKVPPACPRDIKFKQTLSFIIFTHSLRILIIMRFVIPIVFYEITNVQCVYWSDTTIFIGRM